MSTHDPIGYTYDADVHCPACTEDKFGRSADGRWIAENAIDSEGNEIGVIAPWDEASDPDTGEFCVDCGACIIEPWESDETDDDDDPDDTMPTGFMAGDTCTVDGYRGIAWRIDGARDGRIVAHMVGDDREFTHDPEDCRKLDDDAFCPSCGQTGCGHYRTNDDGETS